MHGILAQRAVIFSNRDPSYQSSICEVFDGSLTTPRIRRAAWTDEGGRGLQLIAALCDRWGTRYMSTGKCIWTEQSLP